MSQDLLARIRFLTQGLIASMALNIGLTAAFAYWIWKESPPVPYYELKPADKVHQKTPLADARSNEEVIASFKELAFEQLVAKLDNRLLVENGYTQRDLALAALVEFHYFDINKALADMPAREQQKLVLHKFSEKDEILEITLYPGLSEEQYKALSHFAHTERWPITHEGLFVAIKKSFPTVDVSLGQAFYITSPFTAVETLFSRSNTNVTREMLLSVLCSGSWQMLTSFLEEQKKSQDLSEARRQSFLLDYVRLESKEAVKLLLKTDFDFAIKKLDDDTISKILVLIDPSSAEGHSFALEVLMSPRGESVRKMAATSIYKQEDMDRITSAKLAKMPFHTELLNKEGHISDKGSVKKARKGKSLSMIASTQTPVKEKKRAPHPINKAEISYTIKDGDSLWKIARLYKTDVETLKNLNQLKSDKLKIGSVLKIPHKAAR